MGVAQAAPAHEKEELGCHPVGEVGMIAAQDSWTNHYYGHEHHDFEESRLEPTEERKGKPKKEASVLRVQTADIQVEWNNSSTLVWTAASGR